MNQNLFKKGIIYSIVLSCFYFSLIDYISYPWIDEIGTTDSAVNYIMIGQWSSHVWPYSYNPLHNFILTGWLKLFGVSHVSVCSLSLFLAFLSYCVLVWVLIDRRFIESLRSLILFSNLYWFGYLFSDFFTQGRIDMLVLLLSVLWIKSLKPYSEKSKNRRRKEIVIYSFFLMLSSVYSIPLLFVLSLFLVWQYKNDRKEIVEDIAISLLSMLFSFLFVCLFYFCNHSLLRFLNTLISFNATISSTNPQEHFLERVMVAYMVDYCGLLLFVLSITVVIYKKLYNDRRLFAYLVFIALIPLIMVLAGRYVFYYTWLFYIPTIILIVYISSQVRYTNFFSIALSVIIMISWMIKTIEDYKNNDIVSNDVSEMKSLIQKGGVNNRDNIVFTSTSIYYYLVDIGCNRWLATGGLHDITSPKEKIINFLEAHVANLSDRKKYMEFICSIEKFDDYIPDRGYLVVENEKREQSLEYLYSKGFQIENKIINSNYSIIKFQK